MSEMQAVAVEIAEGAGELKEEGKVHLEASEPLALSLP